ncbi:uncharacterized protein LOC128239464 [Mya arenaria]|uniref:uncharacterized protein LOC128239464 n=1 Tax=Mya arenaria TaxID=6604 RepID=UPI0022E14A82|nr:uncharacterized protein LOC128239464 [Mya arenaria]
MDQWSLKNILKFQTLSADMDSQRYLSQNVSKVLEDIGVSKYIVEKRRRTWLMLETNASLSAKLSGSDITVYHFGSQSEGTTTPGMMSDVDMLSMYNNEVVLQEFSDFQPGKKCLLMVKTDSSPPQHCYLQRLKLDLPQPLTKRLWPDDVIDDKGRVLISNTWFDKILGEEGKVLSHGPSRSWMEEVDIVVAFSCEKLPEECKFMFHRPRPGHWPKLETLGRARKQPACLVPQGHPETPWFLPEWRFSTSLIERLLVFDFTTTQIKVYTLLKMIRKTFIKPHLGEKFSTFHIKTAMMFTIESYPEDIWREDNIVQCAIYCLTTIQRWLKIGHCPHFTIADVNLFVGKLHENDRVFVYDFISRIISDCLQCIFFITMDDFGSKLLKQIAPLRCVSRVDALSERIETYTSIRKDLYIKILKGLCRLRIQILEQMDTHNSLCEKVLLLLETEFSGIGSKGTEAERTISKMLFPMMFGHIASAKASLCIERGCEVGTDISSLYEKSFKFDLLSNRLKYAFMLYCSGQYQAAAKELSFCEHLFGYHVWNFCSCSKHGSDPDMDDEGFNWALHHNEQYSLQICVALCVKFSRFETFCIPKHLGYEMYRTHTLADFQERHFKNDAWMSYAVVDAVPLMFYLQFLTYRQLNMSEKKVTALEKLDSYAFYPRGSPGHIDTICNMLGHCYELENNLEEASTFYKDSLYVRPRNNAAIWHIIRLIRNALYKQ